MTRILAAVFTALCLTLPATAQDSDQAERLAVAQEYVDATMADMDMAAFIKQMWIPVIQQMKNSGKNLSPEQITQIETLYNDTLTEPLTNVMLQQVDLMAELMTLEELSALRDFYNSEDGRAVMQKMPTLSQRQQPMIAEMLRNITPQMLPRLQEIISGS
ncbi:hypothetical protein PEL8287_00315 [Roseovarius litorisediminis]|uniref:DUF2059 domain-containing protein n=1 Tax=Roseovarius litorisediminis TaxID=1312363 RepID=A0A1Y5R9B3_9RHOB|nr:DUF2059 domain-containing protein [Roseovarius litorisediminis]SLN12131.1 hypothetical protein PEL8287_00315 [Roseovarius litorisediminis]